jgi:CheY-like chemotaxis protein
VAVILAIEPDRHQAERLRALATRDVGADITIVDSREAAIAALTNRIPDVILLTALLSPRDEDELMAHLRSLAGVDHVQTHTIPVLASAPAQERRGGGLLDRLRRRKDAAPPAEGCDPAVYAGELRGYLARATELKAELASAPPVHDLEPAAGRRHEEELDVLAARAAEDRLAEEAERQAEAWRREQAHRLEEQQRAFDEEKAARERRAAEERRLHDEMRAEEERRWAEEQRRADEERRAREDERIARERRFEEERRLLDEQRLAQ